MEPEPENEAGNLQLSHQELVLIANCMNNALNLIEDWEFDTLVGGTKEEVRRLQARVITEVDRLAPPAWDF